LKEFGIGIIGYGFMGKAHTYAYRTMPFIMRIALSYSIGRDL